jgi:hypothetical protein
MNQNLGNRNKPASHWVDLRPPAIFSLGVTGHREIGSPDLDAKLNSLFVALLKSVQEIASANVGFFSSSQPRMRVVSMGAQGADLTAVRKALDCGCETAIITPFPIQDYESDFDANGLVTLKNLVGSSTIVELPGQRAEGGRAYERASDVILENIDCLIAIWDGDRARGRAGTAEVVQRAVFLDERWLEYRVIAQRLAWISVLHPFAFGLGSPLKDLRGRSSSWVDWYVGRMSLAVGLPSGRIEANYLSRAAFNLLKYADNQISYHRSKLHQLGQLEARLKALSVASLVITVVLAILTAVLEIRFKHFGSDATVFLLLTVFPVIVTSLNGLRAELDLVRLVERSAQTSVLIARIRRAISAAEPSYDKLQVSAHRLTSIIDDELREWRFVLESRRSRVGLRKPLVLRWLSHKLLRRADE